VSHRHGGGGRAWDIQGNRDAWQEQVSNMAGQPSAIDDIPNEKHHLQWIFPL